MSDKPIPQHVTKGGVLYARVAPLRPEQCPVCRADLEHGVVVGMHGPGCELERLESRVRELEQALEVYFHCEIHEYSDDPEHNYCRCGWAKNNPVHCVSALQGTDKAAKNG